MRIFLDTEFIEDGRTIDPISIGLVREDDKEYYAEFRATDLSKANPWVVENVLPNLKTGVLYTNDTQESQGSELIVPTVIGWNIEEIEWLKGTDQIVEELLEFCRESPEFWGYFCDYDWVLLCQLFGTMMDLPEGWPMFCLDLKQEMVVNLIANQQIELAYPQPTTHNALDDAKWIKKAHQYVCL